MSPRASYLLAAASILVVTFLESSDAFLSNQASGPRFQAARTTTTRYFFDFLKQEEEKEPPKTSEEKEPEKVTSDDPVDKIFGFFFGAKEEEPMGMKRFGRGTKARTSERSSMI